MRLYLYPLSILSIQIYIRYPLNGPDIRYRCQFEFSGPSDGRVFIRPFSSITVSIPSFSIAGSRI
ncbi:hypothetical protein BDA96_06G052900 [Sorghum bicolor]|uniref:Uncharacterized protein n=1 Tax=Sorghum bicolor TaxID=4558 RepID=A0A921QQT8_SORBI|nr:hypothetical protein BDA96_06G052900 [Sorghum bicolor]